MEPQSPTTRSLYQLIVELDWPPPRVGSRAISNILGGTFKGDRLSGKMRRSGADWPVGRPDGTSALDIRALMEADDGALIYMTALGRYVVPESIQNMSLTERANANPADYYIRISPLFETDAPRYSWLNGIQAIGLGKFRETGLVVDMFELL